MISRNVATLALALCLVVCIRSRAENDLAQYVDPMIGTDAHGHVFPGACVPFGMVQLSPDNGTSGWDWCSGYHYSSDKIAGFSHMHLSGTGCGDLCDISVMPTTKTISADMFKANETVAKALTSKFRHENEKATPGYYKVLLDDDQITVELTATQRTGFHRYTFPAGAQRTVVFDLGFAINGDKPYDTMLKQTAPDTLIGHRHSKGWAPSQKVFFVAKFSEPITSMKTFLSQIVDDAAQGKNIKGALSFGNGEKPLMIRVALSSASVEGAIKNLEAENKHEWKFEKVAEDARKAWNHELSRIEVETPNADLRKTFYTAAYHTYFAPSTFSDVDGGYKGYKDQPMVAKGYTKYHILSLWDTFRALQPLMALVNPEMTNDVVKGALAQYQETGQLPIWELAGSETGCMIGYHVAAVISEAIVKNIGDFDRELALEAMKAAANQKNYRGLDHYRALGYVPFDKEGESVSKTLEYAYDDWCIAQAARVMGKKDDERVFELRSQSYKNLFDAETKFMRPKSADGKWRTPFDPKESGGRPRNYTEGNGWQWTWSVQHDVPGLIELQGGKDAFCQKLDGLFTAGSEQTGEDAPIDVSGLIGQYAHGNEPVHHVAYLYNRAGRPWKTQEWVNRIASTLYTAKLDGLCGNDDCGQMSAWYIFSVLGFYPLNPVDGKYEFGCPRFDKATVRMPHGKLTIIAENASDPKNIYIQSASLNGKPLDRTYVTFEEISHGGDLHFVMGAQPKK